MTETTHGQCVKRVLLHATIYDGRIRHLPAAIRRCKSTGSLRKLVREVMNHRSYGLDFRPGCGSGRSQHWHEMSWDRYGAYMRDLMMSGYSRADATRIARSAVVEDRCTWAVLDTPPADVSATEMDSLECYGWDERLAAKMECSVEHVRAWTAWRRRRREPAQQGRRTRRWRRLSERLRQEQMIRDRQEAIARMDAASREVADLLAPVFGRNELMRSWSCTGTSVVVSHDFAKHCPDWIDVAASVGVLVHTEGSMLRLNDSVYKITVLETA